MRNKIIRIRVSDAELAAVRSVAIARGLSMSDLLRRVAQGIRVPARRFHQADVTILLNLLAELGRIGSNLNQLTRRANAGKLNGHDADLAATLAGIDALRTRVRELIT